ncbi:FAD assembly factor SdhE [Acetobacter fallax]|uniref:FAD assembly factor SdhE n=1 Tax=Acetobacter fallax TaxID=1737473 RepID=A0ABX0K7J2_9PROT|nr:succinate dehydrogenase assembly factor 2 [Acetobacter fallax]NHO31188.1 succinate dehydrogenase assembly factor 2 [Acetobacter fallax]NHO34745.1 succinate dehydrogenase assembly factor 2 [Acetobacter fallax]
MEQNETISPATSSPDASAGDAQSDLERRRKRLLFRSQHRGTFETDILIGGFVEKYVNTMDATALDDIEAVLETPDPVLTDWLFGRLPVPEECETPMLRALLNDAHQRSGITNEPAKHSKPA